MVNEIALREATIDPFSGKSPAAVSATLAGAGPWSLTQWVSGSSGTFMGNTCSIS